MILGMLWSDRDRKIIFAGKVPFVSFTLSHWGPVMLKSISGIFIFMLSSRRPFRRQTCWWRAAMWAPSAPSHRAQCDVPWRTRFADTVMTARECNSSSLTVETRPGMDALQSFCHKCKKDWQFLLNFILRKHKIYLCFISQHRPSNFSVWKTWTYLS